MIPLADAAGGQRITNSICKEYPFEPPLSGKFDFNNAVLYDSKSTAWAFFTDDYVAGSPLASPVFKADDAAREALIADVRNALRKYTSSTELAFPIAAHLLSAKVSAA
jgi:hypothetical protein